MYVRSWVSFPVKKKRHKERKKSIDFGVLNSSLSLPADLDKLAFF
jgi:hypothetical protein